MNIPTGFFFLLCWVSIKLETSFRKISRSNDESNCDRQRGNHEKSRKNKTKPEAYIFIREISLWIRHR